MIHKDINTAVGAQQNMSFFPMRTLMCMTEIGRDVDAFNCRKSANFPIYFTEVGTRL